MANPHTDFVDHNKFFDCVHCGLCLSACPTYVELGTEMDSPRGRIATMRSLHEGRFDLDAEVVRHLDLCLGCRACETACPSGVHYGELIEGVRPFIEQYYKRPLRERFKRIVRGTSEGPGVVKVIEKLRRRTQIDPATLDIQVDKRPYPWKVKVKGTRQIVGESGPGESFELELDLVRASREENLEGLLVWSIRAKGDPIDTVLAGTERGRIP